MELQLLLLQMKQSLHRW